MQAEKSKITFPDTLQKNAQVAFSFSVAFYAPAVLLGCSH